MEHGFEQRPWSMRARSPTPAWRSQREPVTDCTHRDDFPRTISLDALRDCTEGPLEKCAWIFIEPRWRARPERFAPPTRVLDEELASVAQDAGDRAEFSRGIREHQPGRSVDDAA